MIVRRWNIVGKPMAQRLLNDNYTVTVAHSRTRDLVSICRRADILAAAVVRSEIIASDWSKAGATAIDVGINRITRDGKPTPCGRREFRERGRVSGRDNIGAWRCRFDDHRLSARQHRYRLLLYSWAVTPGGADLMSPVHVRHSA